MSTTTMLVRPSALVAALAVSLLLPGCGGIPESVVVLLPNDDGSVGVVEVENAGRTRTLSRANEAAELRGADRAPGESFVAEPEDIERAFGKAMAARPEPPVRFLLYFETGGTNLTPVSERQLPEILAAIRGRTAPEVDISGHTDRSGSKDYNRKLAGRRGEAVRDRIVEIGVEPERISVSSHGENNPLIETDDGVAEPRNRRVEVVIR